MALIANALLVILSVSLGVRILRQHLERPRAHKLYYSIGLLLTGLAAFPELYHKLSGGLPTGLWWLYWASASTLVGFLGVGTAYLLSERFGKIMLGVVALLATWVVVATLLTAGPTPAVLTVESMAKAPTAAIKLPFVIQNILASLVIFGGAILSYVRTRGVYNIYIALGTLVFASGGAAAGLLAFPGAFYFTQTAGMILLYAGVALSGAQRPAQRLSGHTTT